MKYLITEIKPKIFLISFKDYYDMCLTFLRYQEFYESPSSKFRGKSFTILNFMEWYSKKYGKGGFTYPLDWGGFNYPSYIYQQVISSKIQDKNKYDDEMEIIYNTCYKIAQTDNFYIIGAVGKKGALKHEIAHGFFYTMPEYRIESTKLVKNLDPEFRKSMNNTLKEMGYTPKVYIDECQAYLSTGLTEKFTVQLKGEHKPFVQLYKKYYKE